MKIVSTARYPDLKHGQVVTKAIAERYFREVGSYLFLTGRKTAELRSSRSSREIILERCAKIKHSLLAVQRNLQWLDVKGFSNKTIEEDLSVLLSRIEAVFGPKAG